MPKSRIRWWSVKSSTNRWRKGLWLSTTSVSLGFPSGKFGSHAILVATYDAAPFTAHANIALTQNPGGTGERQRVGRISGALTWAASEQLTLAIDAGAAANPDPAKSSWPAALLVGAIYTVQPGFDVDIGYQSSVRTSPKTSQWLVGFTYRFAP